MHCFKEICNTFTPQTKGTALAAFFMQPSYIQNVAGPQLGSAYIEIEVEIDRGDQLILT